MFCEIIFQKLNRNFDNDRIEPTNLRKMLQNYFKIAWRNLVRNKIYSAINILGLAIGISACMLIFLYVRDELTYEQHFDKADRIFRVTNDINLQGQTDKFALTPFPLGPTN
jgi:putative ABC transport system permease protein